MSDQGERVLMRLGKPSYIDVFYVKTITVPMWEQRPHSMHVERMGKFRTYEEAQAWAEGQGVTEYSITKCRIDKEYPVDWTAAPAELIQEEGDRG